MLLLVGITHAADTVDSTFNRLAHVGYFAFGGVGRTGVISQGEKDYELILYRQSAMADLERLFSVGNTQAKCYALVGIRKMDPDRFKKLSQSLRNSKAKVSTIHGCIISSESLAAVLRRIEAGQYSPVHLLR